MMKRLFCILLSLTLLTAVSFALAEDNTEAAAVTEAAEEEPVLLVTINGQEIRSDDDYMSRVYAYYLDTASSYGYDTSNQELLDTIKA